MTQNRIHPYIPAFRRYPPEILLAVGRIEAARRTLRDALILPAQEEILRRDARVGSIHYSNLIEGNELPVIEALRAAEHELEPTSKAKLELVNYVSALEFVEREHRAGSITYTPEFLKQLHGVLTKGLGRADGRFKPHHEAEWRDGWARVADGIATYHVAPDPDDVSQLMADRLDWLERRRHDVEYPVPILAGIAHFEVAEVHPFADYNGRVARLFAIAIFYRRAFWSDHSSRRSATTPRIGTRISRRCGPSRRRTTSRRGLRTTSRDLPRSSSG